MLRFLAIALALAVGVSTAAAQTRESAPSPPTPLAASGAGFYKNSWALVIGINGYQRSLPRLNYAVADANGVVDALQGLGFPRANIRRLLDQQATKANIERVLYREFGSKMGADDRLLVYFAGHGETVQIKGGEEGFLLPFDADPTALATTAIQMEELKRIGQRVKPRHVLFVMDACFSGFALTRDVSIIGATPRDLQALATVQRASAVQVITAGRKGERSVEQGGHGVFTRYLLEGLRGFADTENLGVVTASQLAAWIEPRVMSDSNKAMTPQYSRLDGQGDFFFPLKPHATPLRVFQARLAPTTAAGSLTAEQRKDVQDSLTLGRFFEARGDTARAQREYRRALEIDPNHPDAKGVLLRLESGGAARR